MPFTTIGDVYPVKFRIQKKVNGQWVPSPSGDVGQFYIVAASDQDAVARIQTAHGHDGATTNVRCEGGVQRILQNVIIAV